MHDAAAVVTEPFCDVGARGPLPRRAAALGGGGRDLQRRGAPLRAAQAAPPQRDPLAARLPRPARRRADDRRRDRAAGDPRRRRARARADLLPTLDPPPELDVAAYVDELFARFANAALEHRASQVATDGSQKLPVRTPGGRADHAAAGTVPRTIALAFAAWIRCLATPGATTPPASARSPIRARGRIEDSAAAPRARASSSRRSSTPGSSRRRSRARRVRRGRRRAARRARAPRPRGRDRAAIR